MFKIRFSNVFRFDKNTVVWCAIPVQYYVNVIESVHLTQVCIPLFFLLSLDYLKSF